jgi:cytochrome P450
MNLMLFLLAGYDTTSTLLLLSLYILATHPEEMNTLQQEIDLTFSSYSDVNFFLFM